LLDKPEALANPVEELELRYLARLTPRATENGRVVGGDAAFVYASEKFLKFCDWPSYARDCANNAVNAAVPMIALIRAGEPALDRRPNMKRILLSAIAAMAVGGAAHAGGGEQDTLNALTASASGATNAAAILLASQQVCGYSHQMLAGSIADLKAVGVDDKRVVAIAYQLEGMANHDTRMQNIVCSGAMKMVNDNNAQRRAGVPQ
jgi:hypothetical protein